MTIIERLRVLGDLVEDRPGPGEALRHPGVLADEHRHLGVLELAAGVAAVEVGVDPRLAGFLLRQRIGAVARAERLEERAAVRAAEVVTLAAAAVVEDLVPAVGVADALEAGGDLGDRGVPVDFLVAAVGPSTHRGGQAVAVVLVVIQAQRLVAGVALRRRMRPCRRGSWRACGLRVGRRCRSCIRTGCTRSAAIHRSSWRVLSDVSACTSARSWRWTRSRGLTSREARATTIAPSIDGGHKHRQFLGARVGDAVGHEPRGDQVGPPGESRGGAVDHRRRLVVLVGSPASTATATTGHPARKSVRISCLR